MGKAAGFLEYERKDGPVKNEEERIKDFCEFHAMLPDGEQRKQAARCMDCGIPFCQAGAQIGGMVSGCPLNNLIPEINDLVYRGKYEEAYRRLSITHSFPEFTGRVCPALCEAACACGLHDDPVSTRENEKAVIEYAFKNGLVNEQPPEVRTGKKVAVVGSGPSGLAAAQLLNRRGHTVTVYERNDRPGGLLMYGIPNMKLDKSVIERRIGIMKGAGISFVTNADIGRSIPAEKLTEENDCVILTCGASRPRDIKVPGRDADGIWFAVNFLSTVTKKLLANGFEEAPEELVKDKDVLVIGGGDTGNDCVGTCIRLGAGSITQIEMMPEPPEKRLPGNPWPEWPKIRKTDYGQEEAIWEFGKDPRVYCTTVKEFIKDEKGDLAGAVLVSLSPEKDKDTGRISMVPVEGTEKTVPAQLVLIAAGFTGCEKYVTESFGIETDGRGRIVTGQDGYVTSDKKIFAAGDMRRGQSLVVWAVSEGRNAARAVDRALMGYTNL